MRERPPIVSRSKVATTRYWQSRESMWLLINIAFPDNFMFLTLFACRGLLLIASHDCDWNRVCEMAEELELGLTLYYFLVVADRISPGHVPAQVLVRVRRSSRNRVRDWGWQAGKLFDQDEPFPDGILV